MNGMGDMLVVMLSSPRLESQSAARTLRGETLSPALSFGDAAYIHLRAGVDAGWRRAGHRLAADCGMGNSARTDPGEDAGGDGPATRCRAKGSAGPARERN